MGILKGLKVLDFSTLLPGPFATMMLADMGADVVKIESPIRTDLLKYVPPVDGDVSAAFAHLHRSKRSLSLDLKKEEAKEVVYKLVQEYDIVVEQFRPGVMDRLGIGYEQLKKVNPKLIFCSITGYGQTGPLKDKAGHDNNYLAVAGVSSYSARRNEAPVPAGIQVADLAGGSMPAVIGILAAVYHREKTGIGQSIDISMTDVVFSLNAIYGAGYLVGGIEPKAESMLLNGGTFYDYYETKDCRYLSIGSLEPKFQKKLCGLIGDLQLMKLSMSSCREEQRMFKEKLTTIIKQKTFDEWLALLGDDFDGCVEPVLTFPEAVHHPHTKARDLIVTVPKVNGGSQQQIAFPIKFSEEEVIYKFAGVQTGEHTEEVLRESGFSEARVQVLKEKNIVGGNKSEYKR
nr:CaiB/BaiF CoA-transferase family protein [Bacillus manliponensis]